MNILGLVGGQALQKASEDTQRSKKEPHIQLKADKLIIHRLELDPRSRMSRV